jgi:hypothetical protein
MVQGYAASKPSTRIKDRYATHRTRIDDDLISLTNSLMSYDLKTVYAILGAQLAQIERPYHAFQTAKMLGFASGLDVPKISIDYVYEGHECIKIFWPKIVPPICRWWKNNRGKRGDELMKEICAIITYVLPLPYNLIQGVISLIGVVLVKNGLDKLCVQKVGQVPEPY